MNASVARLYLDLSELGRRLVQEHFNLTSHLHYSYTHLVCRTANSGERGTHSSACLHLNSYAPHPCVPPSLPILQMLLWFAVTSATQCMRTTVSWIKTWVCVTRCHQHTPGETTGVWGGGKGEGGSVWGGEEGTGECGGRQGGRGSVWVEYSEWGRDYKWNGLQVYLALPSPTSF